MPWLEHLNEYIKGGIKVASLFLGKENMNLYMGKGPNDMKPVYYIVIEAAEVAQPIRALVALGEGSGS